MPNNEDHPMVTLMKKVSLRQMAEWFDTPYDEVHAEEVSKVLGETIYDDTMDEWQEYYYRLDAMIDLLRRGYSLNPRAATQIACETFNHWFEDSMGGNFDLEEYARSQTEVKDD